MKKERLNRVPPDESCEVEKSEGKASIKRLTEKKKILYLDTKLL